MPRLWLAALVLTAPIAACDKGPSTLSPDAAVASADAPTPSEAAVDGGEPKEGDEAGAAPDDETSPAVVEPSTEPAPSEPSSESPESTESPEAAPPEPEATAALELPKPIHRNAKKSCGKDPGVGTRLKGFKLPTTEPGKTYSNGSFRGRVMLVNFWGTWCKPCLKELPKFSQLYRRYRKHGMTLLAIATDEDVEAVKGTLAKHKIAAKVATGGEDYAGQYASEQFPFTFVVDHKGVIQASYFGYEAECMGQLEADIRTQLVKRAAAKKK